MNWEDSAINCDDLAVEVMGSNLAWYKAWVINVFSNNAMCRFEKMWKPDQRVPFLHIRELPRTTASYRFKKDEDVEVLSFTNKNNPPAWWPATILSEGTDGQYYRIHYKSCAREDIVNKNTIRPVIKSQYINDGTFLKFSREIPEKLRDSRHIPGVLDSKAFERFREDSRASLIRYDSDTNEIIVLSRDAQVMLDVEKCFDYQLDLLVKKADMLERNYSYQTRLTHSPTNDTQNTPKEIDSSRHIEEFKIHPNFMGLAIGTRGKNINKARAIEGIIDLELIEDQCLFKIRGQTAEAVREARNMLEYGECTIDVEHKMAPKLIGKKGTNIQSIIDMSDCIRVRIENENVDTPNAISRFVFVGTMESLRHSRILMNSAINHAKEMEEIAENIQVSDQKLREKIYGKQQDSAPPVPMLTPRTPITPPYPAGANPLDTDLAQTTVVQDNAAYKIPDREDQVVRSMQQTPTQRPINQTYSIPDRPVIRCIETQTEPLTDPDFVRPVIPRQGAAFRAKVDKPLTKEIASGINAKSPRLSTKRRSETSVSTTVPETVSPRLMGRNEARSSYRDTYRDPARPDTRRSYNNYNLQPKPQRVQSKPSVEKKPKVDIKQANEKIGSALSNKQTKDSNELRIEQQAAIEDLIKAEAQSKPQLTETKITTLDNEKKIIQTTPSDEDKENANVHQMVNKNTKVDNKKINENLTASPKVEELISAMMNVEVLSNTNAC